MNSKNSGAFTLVAIGILVCLCFIVYKLYFSPLTVDDCLRLGSNYRTEQCLEKINAANPSPIPSTFMDLTLLNLSNSTMTGNTYYQNNPTFSATLTNNSERIAKDVFMRVRFYKNKINTCDNSNTADDTEYIKAVDVILPHDSKAIKTVVNTNFDTSGQFWWCTDIAYAHEAY